MYIPKYATSAERKAALREKAKKQMLAQWEQKRQESGQPLGYFGGHRRVRTARGPAKHQPCNTCEKSAQHWAHIHDTPHDDPKNYWPMCQSCHWKYDDVINKKNSTLTSEQRSALAYKAWETKRARLRDNLVVD